MNTLAMHLSASMPWDAVCFLSLTPHGVPRGAGMCRPVFDLVNGGCAMRADIVVSAWLSALDSLQAGQSGPGLGLRPAPAAASHGTSASAPPLHSTPTVGPGRAGVAHAADAGARATPASSSRRVSFLLTPEQERRVSTGGSLCDSGNGSDPVPSSPRVVVTRAAGQPVGASKAAEAYVGWERSRCGRGHSFVLFAMNFWCDFESLAPFLVMLAVF